MSELSVNPRGRGGLSPVLVTRGEEEPALWGQTAKEPVIGAELKVGLWEKEPVIPALHRRCGRS